MKEKALEKDSPPNYASMTVDALKLEYDKIDKMKYPKEAIEIYDELSRRKKGSTQAAVSREAEDPLVAIEAKIQGKIKLKALASILIFLGYVGSQTLAVFLSTFFYFAYQGLTASSMRIPEDQIASRTRDFLAENVNTLMTAEFLAGGLALIVLSRIFASNLITVAGSHGVGWVWSGFRYSWKAIMTGAALALGMLLISGGKTYPTFVNHADVTVSLELVCMIVSILFLAPIAEEYLFRGLLYAGFTNSWNQARSSVLVTGLFVLMHLPSVEFQILPLISIFALALATLHFRKTSGVLAPAIMVHIAYNLTILSFVMIRNF